MEALLFPVLLIGGFYLLAVRPQKNRIRAVQAIQASLAPGQEVVTTAGLYGTITAVDDETVHLVVAPGVELRFARGAVARPAPVAETASEPDSTSDPSSEPVVPG